MLLADHPHHHSTEPLGVALLITTVVHAMLILGISFDIHRSNPPQPERTLDITIVQPQLKEEQPDEPEYLAQTSQQGGSEIFDEPTPPSTPASKPAYKPSKQVTREMAPLSSAKPEPRPEKRVITAKRAEQTIRTRETKAPIKAKQKPKFDFAQLMASTERESKKLAAELDQYKKSAGHLRRKSINASTQEYKYASYLEAWRKKVERIGNLNYPDEAKRKKLSGNLLLHVALNADGSIRSIRIAHSSGHKVLDDAAIRIVRLAAPFAPFPPEIRKEVDILDINRTWQFISGGNLFQ